MSNTKAEPEKTGRIQQFRDTYRLSKKTDPRIGLWILGSFLLVGALGFVVFFFLLPGGGVLGLVLAIIGALLFGSLAALIVFGRRAQRSAYSQMEGQLGAAAAALRMLRRGWQTEPAVAFTKQQDVVHRVVGPPGIVLVGEGNPNRLRQLMGTERRRHERVVADTPIHEVTVGNGEGQVPLPKLVRHVQKLGRQVKPAEMTDILNRLKALDAQKSNIPLPKGPVPTSMKGMRGNLRGR
jgi:type II secretory pathway pseudopilin PulG